MNLQKVELPFKASILQDIDSQSISTDAAFLVEAVLKFNENKKNAKCLDIGSGCGILAIMLALNKPNWLVTGIEIQKHLHEISVNNAQDNGLSCKFENIDLKNYKQGGYDIIISNPPFFKQGSIRLSPNKSKAISRCELKCTAFDVINCIKANLATNGTAFLLYPKQRFDEIKKLSIKNQLKLQNTLESGINNKKKVIFIIKK